MNTQQRAAMQMALEALEEATTYTASTAWSPSMTNECEKAATALREALAQPQGELVGYWNGKETAWFEHELCGHPAPDDCTIPLYTTPPSSQLADAAVEAMRIETLEKAALKCEEACIGTNVEIIGKAFAAAIRSMK